MASAVCSGFGPAGVQAAATASAIAATAIAALLLFVVIFRPSFLRFPLGLTFLHAQLSPAGVA